jgi:phosphate transport system substrate-binding protein
MFKKDIIFTLIIVSFLFVECKQNEQNEQTILKGSVSILVDETLIPIVEDQVAVFESSYDAKIKLVPESESEVLNSLVTEKAGIAIMARNLTKDELKIFEQKKIIPRITPFATDAIAFITNKNNNDTLVALKNIVEFMQGKPNSTIKGLVFDNPNSSTVRFMNNLAGIKATPKQGVFSFKTNEEVIKFVSENNGMIGVVGVNWLSQPSPKTQEFVDKVTVLEVKNYKSQNYYAPTQNNLAEKKYPLARDLYIINCQGNAGLGMGFASFIAGDIGQRIILKSGLLPVRIPGRNLKIRKEINNDKK